MSHPIRANTDTRTASRGPVLSGKWPQEEPALVSVRWSEDARWLGSVCRYKRRFTPPSPIWKVAARKWIYSGIDTAIDNVQMCTRNADTRGDSRRPVLSGKWQRRKVNLLWYRHERRKLNMRKEAACKTLVLLVYRGRFTDELLLQTW